MKLLSKPRNVFRACHKGFTLVETMIALFVFTFGVLALIKLQAASINSNTSAQSTAEATNVAYATVERLSAMNWNDQSARFPPASPEHEKNFISEISISENSTPGAVTIADDKGQASVRLITVKTSFTDKNGVERSITLKSLKPRR
ncbi:MAG: prepilin-type N-terminal cleavage/methylation domain-containing protein [Desulfobacteraceae bacterium]|nr:prepilin-type N-terminal cleavage/methylation domain-containing protein [Desulfobacteraceae bacterium]